MATCPLGLQQVREERNEMRQDTGVARQAERQTGMLRATALAFSFFFSVATPPQQRSSLGGLCQKYRQQTPGFARSSSLDITLQTAVPIHLILPHFLPAPGGRSSLAPRPPLFRFFLASCNQIQPSGLWPNLSLRVLISLDPVSTQLACYSLDCLRLRTICALPDV